jgi:diaminohydroxyphosphoribosylaminopyrimidine deaminase/5-amino-6-(5-phosphoribosylamino)uracil reductase
MDHRFFMKRAIRLASKAKGMTSPNPMVGAVLVKNGRIIAEDYHRRPGTPHAEALVIAQAGAKAKGATLYASLEPCCHTDKRTPPCTKAVIAAGIRKVIVAMKDPNPKVSGKGIRAMKAAGISVESGVLEEEAKRLNEFYIHYMKTKRPFVILKVAMTLDGKIATPSGESKWITGEKARRLVHQMRSSVDAIMTAIGTIKADDPELTARVRGGRNPKKIVIDPELEMSPAARLLGLPPETIIVTKKMTPADKSDRAIKISSLLNSNIRIISFKESLHLSWLMERLAQEGITSLMIEGGSSLNAHALEDGIVNKVMFFISPKIIGGRDSYPAVGGKTFRKLAEAYRLKDVSIKKLGDDILVEGYL